MITSSYVNSARNSLSASVEKIRILYGHHFYDRKPTELGEAVDSLRKILRHFLNKSSSRSNGAECDTVLAQLLAGIDDYVDQLAKHLNHGLDSASSTSALVQTHKIQLNALKRIISLLATAFDVAPHISSQETTQLSHDLQNELNVFESSRIRIESENTFEKRDKPVKTAGTELKRAQEEVLQSTLLDGSRTCWNIQHASYCYMKSLYLHDTLDHHSNRPVQSSHSEEYIELIKSASILYHGGFAAALDICPMSLRRVQFVLGQDVSKQIKSLQDSKKIIFSQPDAETRFDFSIFTPIDEARMASKKLRMTEKSTNSVYMRQDKIHSSSHSLHEVGSAHAEEKTSGYNTPVELSANSLERLDTGADKDPRNKQLASSEAKEDIALYSMGSESIPTDLVHGSHVDYHQRGRYAPNQLVDSKLSRETMSTSDAHKSNFTPEAGISTTGPPKESSTASHSTSYSTTTNPIILPPSIKTGYCYPSSNINPVNSPSHVGLSCDLMVSSLEQDITVRRLEDIELGVNEIEVPNGELSPEMESRTLGFYDNISASSNATGTSDIFLPARLRLFKNLDHDSMCLYTERSGQRIDMSFVQASGSELVPTYTFADTADKADLHLRHNGDRCSPVYRFQLGNRSQNSYELYGFQGALMGCSFEHEYSAKSMSLCSRSREEKAHHPKIQFWSRDADPRMQDAAKILRQQQSHKGSHSIGHKVAPHLNDYLSKIGCSYLLLYARGSIHVIVISSRICTVRNVQTRTFRWRNCSDTRSQTKTIKLCPDKENGCSAISIRTIKADRGEHAGLPLGRDAISFTDQDGSDFENYQSLTIDFALAETCTDFEDTFHRLQEDWKQRCAPFEQFRELQRHRRVKTSTSYLVA